MTDECLKFPMKLKKKTIKNNLIDSIKIKYYTVKNFKSYFHHDQKKLII